VATLFGLAAYESQYAEGEAGELVIRFRVAVPTELPGAIQGALIKAHVALPAPVEAQGNVLKIRFRKGLAIMGSLAVVLGIAFSLLLLTFVVGWTLYRGLGGGAVAGILTGGVGLIALAVLGIALMGARRYGKK